MTPTIENLTLMPFSFVFLKRKYGKEERTLILHHSHWKWLKNGEAQHSLHDIVHYKVTWQAMGKISAWSQRKLLFIQVDSIGPDKGCTNYGVDVAYSPKRLFVQTSVWRTVLAGFKLIKIDCCASKKRLRRKDGMKIYYWMKFKKIRFLIIHSECVTVIACNP